MEKFAALKEAITEAYARIGMRQPEMVEIKHVGFEALKVGDFLLYPIQGTEKIVVENIEERKLTVTEGIQEAAQILEAIKMKQVNKEMEEIYKPLYEKDEL